MGQGQVEGKAEKKGDNKVVVRVDMDCEACKQKVRKVLKNFPGVENIDLDMDEQKVTVKGNVDAWRVYEALRKKCGKRTILVYPQLSKEEERKAKEDSLINSVNKIVESITDLLTPKPPNTIVELKVRMHCGACAKKIKKVLLRLDGVMEVEGDMASDKVVVKGRDLDAETVCDRVRHSGKPCDVISFKKEEKAQEKKGEKKEEKKSEKKEEKEANVEEKEEQKDQKQGKKKEGKQGENKEENQEENKGENKEENKAKKKGANKEGNKGEKKSEKKEEMQEETKEENHEKNKPKKDNKGGKNGSKNEKKEENKADDKEEAKQPANEGEQEADLEVKKFVYMPYQTVPEYAYAPQIFSDENPNACSLM